MSVLRQDVHNSDLPVLCRSCEARHQGMCGVLEPQQLLELAKSTRKARHLPGAELAGESTPIDAYANVMAGVVKLTKGLQDGRQQLVGLQFAPDFLGRLFASENSLTAQAASAVELCVVPKATLEALIAKNPALEHRLMQQTLRELDEARDWMVTLGRKSAQEKVASLLLLIARHLDPHREEANAAVFELPLSRLDIADYLGLTIETVSRQMTRLRQMDLITITKNRQIGIPDLQRLERYCG